MAFRCWLRDRGVLLRTAVDYARVFPFIVTEDDCTLDANFVLLFTFHDDSSSSIRTCPFLAECDRIQRPGGRTTHLTSWRPGVATSGPACSGQSHKSLKKWNLPIWKKMTSVTMLQVETLSGRRADIGVVWRS